jgi:hypothetical protein
MDIYLLTEKKTGLVNANVLVEVFTSEEALKTYLMQHIQLSPVTTLGHQPGFFNPTFEKTYQVQKLQANSDVIVEAAYPQVKLIEKDDEVPGAYINLTVQSQSDPMKTYAVSMSQDGEIEGCTCPAFEFNNQQACKHMMAATYSLNPLHFGVPRIHISRDFYNDPWSKAQKTWHGSGRFA